LHDAGAADRQEKRLMGIRMFDELLDSGTPKARKRRKVVPVSIGVHALALLGVLVLPLYMEDMPEPVEDQVVRAFFVEAAPPPPPPPPPPPAAPKAVVTAPKIEKPKIEPVATPRPVEPKFVAPVEDPEPVAPTQAVETGLAGSDEGVPGGVEGGVPEGVEGGTVGGVVGGEIGGVEGGTVGGEVGGTPGGVVGAPPAPEPEPVVPSGPVRVGGQIKPPRKLNDAPPVYPSIAREARVQGVVILEATIGPDGSVDNVKVLRGIPLLNEAAVDAVRKWRYSPTTLNGVPVPVIMSVTVNFTLGG
jgi:protein TonB